MSDTTREAIRLWLAAQFAELVKVDPEAVDGDAPFEAYGINSLDMVHVIASGMKHFRIKVQRADLSGVTSINGLVEVFGRNMASPT